MATFVCPCSDFIKEQIKAVFSGQVNLRKISGSCSQVVFSYISSFKKVFQSCLSVCFYMWGQVCNQVNLQEGNIISDSLLALQLRDD